MNGPQTVGLTPVKQAILALEEMKGRLDALVAEPIAIVGVSCRFPGGANSPEAYWSLLSKGVDAVIEIPPDRWDPGPAEAAERWAGLLDDIWAFDAAAFGISMREAESLDPQQRLLLEVCSEALESSGVGVHDALRTRTGVFVGISTHDYEQRALAAGAGHEPHLLTGTSSCFAAGRLSYALKLMGPAMAVDTACSSSLVALHLACQSLRSRESDVAVVAGVNALLSPTTMRLLGATHALSPQGRCRMFDARGAGYVRGEGCGALVLRRLSDAVANGEPIRALIRASAINQDGASTSLTAPNGASQAALLRETLARSRLKKEQITYIEAHGTGTPLGDPIEAEALVGVYAREAPAPPCAVGSAKTNIGHLEAAAGIAGVIKVVLAMEHGEIPRNLHFDRLNPRITLEGSGLYVPVTQTPWPTQSGPRCAAVSSFGLSGTNAHVLLSERPTPSPRPSPLEKPRVFALSGRSSQSLARTAAALAEVMHRVDSEADVAHTLATRVAGPHRAAFVASSRSSAQAAFAALAAGSPVPRGAVAHAPSPARIAFLFTGQGSQYRGMGAELYREFEAFRSCIDRCAEALQGTLRGDLRQWMFEAPDDALANTDLAQPALFSLQVALVELWRSWGVEAQSFLGHSVGQFAAAWAAGAFTLETGLKLVARRGQLMQALPRNGAMASLPVDEATARGLIAGEALVSIAGVNAPQQTVVSGERAAMDRVLARARATGVAPRELNVSHAFHSPLLDPMLDEWQAVVAASGLVAPRGRLMSDTHGTWVGAEISTPEFWRKHAREPVRFHAAVSALLSEKPDLVIEIGPTPTLLHLASQAGATARMVMSLRKGQPERDTLLEAAATAWASGARVDLARLVRERDGRLISLPTTAWDHEHPRLSTGAAPRLERSAAETRLHGPLGVPVEGPTGATRLAWRSTWSSGEDWLLGEHRVGGVPVFPAAGFVELLLAAATTWRQGPIELENVEFASLLTVEPERPVELQVRLDEQHGVASLRIDSRLVTGGPWRSHVTAWAHPLREVAPVAARPAAPPAGVGDFYTALGALGLDYGPGFRVLQSLRGVDHGVVAHGLAPAAGHEAALLDGAFHALAVALNPGVLTAAVPVRIARLRQWHRPGTDTLVQARAQKTTRGFAAQLDVWSGADAPCLGIDGLELKELESAGQAAVTAIDPGWADVGDARSTRSAERWVVVDDATGLVPALLAEGAQARSLGPREVENGLLGFQPQTVVVNFTASGSAPAVAEGAVRLAARVIQAAARLPVAPRVFFVTPLARPVGDKPASNFALAALGGLVRVAQLEHPQLRCTWVDISDDTSAAELIRALKADDAESEIALRTGRRFASRLWTRKTRAGSATRLVEGAASEPGIAQADGELSRWIKRAQPGDLWLIDADESGATEQLAFAAGRAGVIVRVLKRPGVTWSCVGSLAPGLIAPGALTVLWIGEGRELDWPADALAPGAQVFCPPAQVPDVRHVLAHRSDVAVIATRVPLARHAAPARKRPRPPPTVFRADRTYLVTGGLGALGLELAQWAVAQGARHLTLVGRRSPSVEAAQVLQHLRDRGAEVRIEAVDVAEPGAAERVVALSNPAAAPLAGVIHAAGVLEDGVLAELSDAAVSRVLHPKVAGAWNLHQATRELPLEFFLFVSSAAGLLGTPGQAAYASANAFLDALAAHRHATGVAALSVAFGPFAGLGMASSATVKRSLERLGVDALEVAPTLSALGELMCREQRAPAFGWLTMETRRWFEMFPQLAASPRWDDLRDSQKAAPVAELRGALGARVRAATASSRPELLSEALAAMLGHALRIAPEKIEANTPLAALGVDSLLGLELRNSLEKALGASLPATLLWTYPTLGALTQGILGALGLDSRGAAPEAPAAPTDELTKLSDAQLLAAMTAELQEGDDGE